MMNTPSTKFTSFHQLTALDINKAPLNFSTFKGQARRETALRFHLRACYLAVCFRT